MIALLAALDPHGWLDIFRYTTALILVFVIGTNCAFIFWAQEVFPRPLYHFWRVFFLGKTIVSAAVAIDIIQHRGSFSYLIPMVLVGASLSLWAMAVIYITRPYRDVIPASQDDQHQV